MPGLSSTLRLPLLCLLLLGCSCLQAQVKNTSPYPKRPSDKWELGFHAGYASIIGDIDSRPGYGGGISVRKSLGHIFSLRADYTGSFNYGLDYRPRLTTAGTWYVANYRNQMHQGNLDVIVSLRTASHYRKEYRSNVYLFAGYGLLLADVDQDNALAGNQVAPGAINYNRSRSAIKKDLKTLMQGYQTNASVLNGNREAIGRLNNNQLIRHAISLGAGVAFKLNSQLSLGIEQRLSIPFSDDMDGVNAGQSNDLLSYTSLRGGITIGNSPKRTAPLWWLNPNNYLYNDLNAPRHMQFPTVVLPDADGDGVTDLFDREPNTPVGVLVDMNGVAKDSDGDGVPDSKDKDILTPARCFPVTINGIGNCPMPECCRELIGRGFACCFYCHVDTTCHLEGIPPEIIFKQGSASLDSKSQQQLNMIAEKLSASPPCRLGLIAFGSSEKLISRLNRKRLNEIIDFLCNKLGTAEYRLIKDYKKTPGKEQRVIIEQY